MKIYTGIGSRKTPEHVCHKMGNIAHALALAGWKLRSGAAPGADTAFETAALIMGGAVEIYLPWKGFEKRAAITPPYYWDIPDFALRCAADIHPVWHTLSPGEKKLHARNVMQILGWDAGTPSDAVICWTEGGVISGGTRTALVLAQRLTIPIWNLGDPEHANKASGDIAQEVIASTA